MPFTCMDWVIFPRAGSAIKSWNGRERDDKADTWSDQKAFKYWLSPIRWWLSITCHAFIHDRDEAEDIAQDVFIQVFESLGKFRFESKLSTWLYRIAVNRSINHCKSPRGAGHKSRYRIMETTRGGTIGWNATTTVIGRTGTTGIITPGYRPTSWKSTHGANFKQVWRTFIQGIAEVMGITLSSVESLLFRAKNNLEKIFNTK